MEIRFVVDYRGVLTDEQYYAAGTVADLPNGDLLVAGGRAEYVASEPKPEPAPVAVAVAPPKPAKKRRTRRAPGGAK